MATSQSLRRLAQSLLFVVIPLAGVYAQNPFPSDASAPHPIPAPPPASTPPTVPQTPPGVPPGWASPGVLSTPPQGDWMNQGSMNVMATGYDSQGVMKQIPLNISYKFNGVNYDVVVNNAWNPYTETWNMDIDIPANSTSYYMNGFTYNFYAMLPIGTFYFNL